MGSYSLNVDIKVRMTSIKYGVKEKYIHFGIPISRSLLKELERFLRKQTKLESF